MRPGVTALIISLFIISSYSLAVLPDELQGSWIIDKPSTARYLRKSPKWKPEDSDMMPRMMKMLGRLALIFEGDTLTQAVASREVSFKTKMVSSAEGKHVFTVEHKGKTVTFTARLTSAGGLNLRPDNTDDMDYYLWKKGTSAAQLAKEEAEFMNHLEKTAVEFNRRPVKRMKRAAPPPAAAKQSTAAAPATPQTPAPAAPKPEPGENSVPFEVKWGELIIRTINDQTVSQINALEEKKSGRVKIADTCSQESFNQISKLSWITDLTLSDSKYITSLEALKSLPGLKRLTLSSMHRDPRKRIDLGPVAALKELEYISCYDTHADNTIALAGLPKLKEAMLYMAAVDDIEFARSTPSIEILNLYGYQHTFKDYQPVLSLTNLKELNIYMNEQATDELLAPLQILTSLEEISMSNSKKVTTLSFLKNCKGMKKISASWCNKITDISALTGMNELKNVSISDSAVLDFSALRNKPNLESLDVSGTAFSDLRIISASKGLRSITFDETHVSNISTLSQHTKLYRVDVPKAVPDSQIQALKKAIPDITINKEE